MSSKILQEIFLQGFLLVFFVFQFFNIMRGLVNVPTLSKQPKFCQNFRNVIQVK